MIIPKQLVTQRFIKVDNDKRPFEKNWQLFANYSYGDTGFLEWLKNNNKYGVLCGINNLVVIDFDDVVTQKEALAAELLPQTFTVKTARKGLYHLYYYVDNPESFKCLNKNKDTLCDVQGTGKQVVGANTLLDDGRSYDVVFDMPISTVSMSIIHQVLDRFDFQRQQDKMVFTSIVPVDDIISKIKSDYRISTLLSDEGSNSSKNPTNCPLHSSKGGKCLSFDDSKGVWHCFHCDAGGDVISLYMKIHSLSFIDAKKELMKKLGIQEKIFNEYIYEKKSIEEDNNTDIIGLRASIFSLILQQKRRDASELIVQYINKYYEGIATIRNDDISEIYYYDKNTGLRTPQGKTLIREICRKILEEQYTTAICNEVISKIEADTYISPDDFFNVDQKELILLNNGIYNIIEKTLIPFDKKYVFFSKISITYTPGIDCPNFKKHLETILPTREDIDVIQELFGYCLYKENFLEIAFIFIGEGRNGKSKTLEVLKRLLGIENTISLSLNQLETDKYCEALLFNKLVNIAGDIGKQILRDTDKFKKAVGRDLITANRKFLTPISFTNTAKLIFSCNELPPTLDTTPGFFSKWLILDFPYRFITPEEYEALPDKTNFRIIDTEIVLKISTPEELIGIFNWAIIGLERLLHKKDFSKSHNINAIKMIWLRRSDSFTAFCQEFIEYSDEDRILKSELRRVYSEYCRKHKIKPSTDKRIRDILISYYGVSAVQYTDDARYWIGIRFKDVNNKKEEIIQPTIEFVIETKDFFELSDILQHVGTCGYCGISGSWISWKDFKGNYLCQKCYNEEAKKIEK